MGAELGYLTQPGSWLSQCCAFGVTAVPIESFLIQRRRMEMFPLACKEAASLPKGHW